MKIGGQERLMELKVARHEDWRTKALD